ncbi:hypothetical protein CP985_14245 [Malaciobacter mytili LMG 24559]|uniref:Uncharacterized protein n=1 Tax=Malaciobacter mytili LMG 24559 TaxID=1032238 RepID=A0AAX2ACG3_9BACT|nr:hypothetical protein [Malaciobacter mytili]AXH16328.1 hypothetical protein AMYT_a0028 [Malaciobacter mytili LMG 24559]RXK12874.1 hypothetical protein CP985_14245 [Malaciobacter mytili LMG 24559]
MSANLKINQDMSSKNYEIVEINQHRLTVFEMFENRNSANTYIENLNSKSSIQKLIKEKKYNLWIGGICLDCKNLSFREMYKLSKQYEQDDYDVLILNDNNHLINKEVITLNLTNLEVYLYVNFYVQKKSKLKDLKPIIKDGIVTAKFNLINNQIFYNIENTKNFRTELKALKIGSVKFDLTLNKLKEDDLAILRSMIIKGELHV